MKLSLYFLRQSKRKRMVQIGLFVLAVTLCLYGAPYLFYVLPTASAKLCISALVLMFAAILAMGLLRYLYGELHHTSPTFGVLMMVAMVTVAVFLLTAFLCVLASVATLYAMDALLHVREGATKSSVVIAFFNALTFPCVVCLPFAALRAAGAPGLLFWTMLWRWLRQCYFAVFLLALCAFALQLLAVVFLKGLVQTMALGLLTVMLYGLTAEYQMILAFEDGSGGML